MSLLNVTTIHPNENRWQQLYAEAGAALSAQNISALARAVDQLYRLFPHDYPAEKSEICRNFTEAARLLTGQEESYRLTLTAKENAANQKKLELYRRARIYAAYLAALNTRDADFDRINTEGFVFWARGLGDLGEISARLAADLALEGLIKARRGSAFETHALDVVGVCLSRMPSMELDRKEGINCTNYPAAHKVWASWEQAQRDQDEALAQNLGDLWVDELARVAREKGEAEAANACHLFAKDTAAETDVAVRIAATWEKHVNKIMETDLIAAARLTCSHGAWREGFYAKGKRRLNGRREKIWREGIREKRERLLGHCLEKIGEDSLSRAIALAEEEKAKGNSALAAAAIYLTKVTSTARHESRMRFGLRRMRARFRFPLSRE